MVDKIISEIKTCLENGCYIAALTMALTLPDICGRAEYGDIGNRKRFIDWYTEHIGQYEKTRATTDGDKRWYADVPYLSGEMLYALRCSLLHSGDTGINGQGMKEEQNKLDSFTLTIPMDNELHSYGSSTFIQYAPDGSVAYRAFEIDIPDICNTLSYVAGKYYTENKEKFNFFRYNIIDRRNEAPRPPREPQYELDFEEIEE